MPERGRPASIDESSVHWIEDGPGNAAYPAWTPDGALLYTYGHDTETAHEAWKNGSQSGYGLRICEPDGTKRDLTRGRCRDYAPCVSPDGQTVFFVTTRGVESESASFSKAAATRLAALDLDTGKVKFLLDAPNGSNSGYTQPAISPDGQFLIWAQLDSFFDTWRIDGARLNSLAAPQLDKCGPSGPTFPASLTGLSPRWHPNGRMICFTGFRAGDPGWGVWVADLPSGKVRRLCSGENPCFSPDGASIAYDGGGMIRVRPFGPGDEPDAMIPDIREEDAPEAIVWDGKMGGSEKLLDISGDSHFAIGDDTTMFIRATLNPGTQKDTRQFLRLSYAEHPRAILRFRRRPLVRFVRPRRQVLRRQGATAARRPRSRGHRSPNSNPPDSLGERRLAGGRPHGRRNSSRHAAGPHGRRWRPFA